MKSNKLLHVRSNCNFSLDYKSGNLSPQTEIIIITTAPKYSLNKVKASLEKVQDISEYRFITDLDGLNQLIGELQLVVKNMNGFEQLSGSFNALIDANKPDKTQ